MNYFADYLKSDNQLSNLQPKEYMRHLKTYRVFNAGHYYYYLGYDRGNYYSCMEKLSKERAIIFVDNCLFSTRYDTITEKALIKKYNPYLIRIFEIK